MTVDDPPGRTVGLPRAAAPATVQSFAARVVAGPDSGREATAGGDRMVIGTHASCDLILTDDTVSRFHAELAWIDGHLVARDLGSRNGVGCQGLTIQSARIPGGATLTLGRTRLRVTIGHERIPVARSEQTSFGALVGGSDAMRAAYAVLERAAHSDATLLIEGETGTGKEAAASAVHDRGRRHPRPFVVVDCGAIPAELLESELFGHERGAFTGAVASHIGAFELAEGGTVFLDEIGELPLALQPKLLRVLEAREVKRVGDARYRPIDVRIIAATHRDLQRAVNQGTFRADLYYRLAVLRVRLPALRDRTDDLPQLVPALLEQLDAPPTALADLGGDAFVDQLAHAGWPGNARELRNYLERCLAMQQAVPLDDTEAASAVMARITDARVPLKIAREAVNARFEREYVTDALARHDGNVTAAARASGVARMYFYRLLWKHGLRSRATGE